MTSESTNAPAGLEARPPESPPRSAAQIEADIERTRERLAGTVDEIVERVKPANVARRTLESAKAQVFEPDGRLRTDRVAIVAGVGVVVVVLVVWRRRSR
jgi:Protein of unknown function (DUF3618)